MIRLHDTMAREKREFVPQDTKRITMYVCGPTVYGRAHIGNARPAVVFDTLARLIRHEYGENSLVYARNVTDVDDKIIAAAEAEGVDPAVITERYERFYLEDMRALGVRDPDIAPHATREIGPMIALIDRLVSSRHAYAAEGHVLFSVSSDPDYGVLSRRDREQMIAGARVEVAPYKRDPADFVLWKPSDPDVIGWDSRWGRGRPGWHLECSAMIEAHLGTTIDIHGGGLDLIFPHHENEIAQSRCAHGVPLARYWVHNGFVDMGAEKMSKSIGNIITPGELLADGWSGNVLRLALLSAHYRSPLPWTEELLRSTKQRLNRMQFCVSWYAEEQDAPAEFIEALADDLNTPLALAVTSKWVNQCLRDITEELSGTEISDEKNDEFIVTRGQLIGMMKMLGLGAADFVAVPVDITESDDEISQKLRLRDNARKAKLFAEADRIRQEVEETGIIVMDFPKTTLWMSDEPSLQRG